MNEDNIKKSPAIPLALVAALVSLSVWLLWYTKPTPEPQQEVTSSPCGAVTGK